jgi:hypothetical protein
MANKVVERVLRRLRDGHRPGKRGAGIMQANKLSLAAAVVLVVCALGIGSGWLPSWSGSTGAVNAAAGQDRKADRQNAPETQISAWGKESNGLRCRVRAPAATEQGMPLDVRVELSYDLNKLGPGVKALNHLFVAAFFELDLVSRDGGKRLTVKPHDPTAGGPAMNSDAGRYVIPLDGRAPKPWKITFPLVMLGDALTPGEWTCRVRYSFPEAPTRWWAGDRAAWDRAGFWHGTVRSGTFRLEVHKETPHIKVFWLPKRLCLEKGLDVSYRKEDSEKVTLPVRNGHLVATYIWPGRFQGALEPGAVLDRWQGDHVGGRKAEYTIEIFETPDPWAHMWMPRMKVLWKRTLTLSATEAEIRNLIDLDRSKGDKKSASPDEAKRSRKLPGDRPPSLAARLSPGNPSPRVARHRDGDIP